MATSEPAPHAGHTPSAAARACRMVGWSDIGTCPDAATAAPLDGHTSGNSLRILGTANPSFPVLQIDVHFALRHLQFHVRKRASIPRICLYSSRSCIPRLSHLEIFTHYKAGIPEKDGPWYLIEHSVSRNESKTDNIGRSDWADWSQSGDLLFTLDGCLYRAPLQGRPPRPVGRCHQNCRFRRFVV